MPAGPTFPRKGPRDLKGRLRPPQGQLPDRKAGWAQSQRVALRSQPQGPRLAPEDVYFVSWSLRRPLMVLAVVRVGEIGPAPCSQLTYPSASGH